MKYIADCGYLFIILGDWSMEPNDGLEAGWAKFARSNVFKCQGDGDGDGPSGGIMVIGLADYRLDAAVELLLV